MIELPNYSSQLMQQLWTLRKEGHFCDCTILVGQSSHHAHKLVLAASSMLFRSLLEGSDTISIDTAVVSSEEFGCLLDMVYTGKLPLGKHNVSRIVAAADSLQMFDVAVGFKNVLTALVNQQPPGQVLSMQTPNVNLNDNSQSLNPERTTSADKVCSSSDRKDCKDENTEEPVCKRIHLDLSESAEPEAALSSQSGNGVTAADVSSDCEMDLGEWFPRLVEILASVSSVSELLNQAAENLDDPDKQVVCRCCEDDEDSSSMLEKLMSSVKDGPLGRRAFLQLLRNIQQNIPSKFPAELHSLLEEVQENTQENTHQNLQENTQENLPENMQENLQENTQENMQENTENMQENLQENMQENLQENMQEPQEPQIQAENQEQPSNEKNQEEEEEACNDEEGEEEESLNAPADSTSPSPTYAPYSCRWCMKDFAYKCRMLAHLKRCPMAPENQLQCPECPAKLPNQRALQRHQADTHGNAIQIKRKVACDLCGRTFAHPSGMSYHKRTEHFDEKPFACEDCGAKFGANSSLKNHMRLHTGEKPYHCKHCDMNFSVAAALAYHTKKKHSEGKMYECQYCNGVFAQSIELTRHVRTHTGDRPYVCRECGKGYSQAHGLSVHLQTFHNLSEPHDCQKCCLSFGTLEEHRQHIQKFHPKEFHKCPTCDKVFSSATLLEKHKSTHIGAKPFSCDLCNKSYQQLSGLWYHNRINHPEVFANHTRQLKTLVQCDVCFKFFPNTASVAKHQAAEHHSAAAAAAHCPYCPAVLGGEEELQEHISSQHQSDEASCCPFCSLVCTSQVALHDHLLSMHMEQEAGKEQPSTSHTVVSGSEGAEHAVGEGQPQPVLVALAESTEVVEVNMYELLNNSSVTFICEQKPPHRTQKHELP